jgi:hypothetical protein
MSLDALEKTKSGNYFEHRRKMKKSKRLHNKSLKSTTFAPRS